MCVYTFDMIMTCSSMSSTSSLSFGDSGLEVRQELFNFFDFQGTGLISHEDLKQVLGQEPLGWVSW